MKDKDVREQLLKSGNVKPTLLPVRRKPITPFIPEKIARKKA